MALGSDCLRLGIVCCASRLCDLYLFLKDRMATMRLRQMEAK